MSEQVKIDDEEKLKRIDELSKVIDKSTAERDALFDTILKPAFKKMVESIIRTYKLYVPDEEFDTTFNDTMSYLTTKISNFKAPKGTKAFSYCGTICKNYLLFKKMQYDKNIRRSVPYEMIREGISDSLNYSDFREDKDNYSRSEKLLSKITEEIQKMIDNREEYRLSDGEVSVGSAIIELFNNWETILKATEDDTNADEEDVNPSSPYKSISNKLQKSKILYFLREETMMSTKEVRDNMRKYKVVYAGLKKMMQEQ
jgi:predicted house-cleaning noncanonical NTP pyrophosphatase (MazG superfamily)